MKYKKNFYRDKYFLFYTVDPIDKLKSRIKTNVKKQREGIYYTFHFHKANKESEIVVNTINVYSRRFANNGEISNFFLKIDHREKSVKHIEKEIAFKCHVINSLFKAIAISSLFEVRHIIDLLNEYGEKIGYLQIGFV
jgi:hypothetical protein